MKCTLAIADTTDEKTLSITDEKTLFITDEKTLFITDGSWLYVRGHYRKHSQCAS